MKKKVFWTKRADRNYKKLNNYLESEWGIDIANSFSKNLFNIIDHLTLFPEMGILNTTKYVVFLLQRKRVFFIKSLQIELLFCSCLITSKILPKSSTNISLL